MSQDVAAALRARRRNHEALVSMILASDRPSNATDTVWERKRAVAAMGFDDADAPWESSPVARRAVEELGELTLDDIGILWGLTRERVRQIEARVLEQIASPVWLARRLRIRMSKLLEEGAAARAKGRSARFVGRIYLELEATTEALEALESMRERAEDGDEAPPGIWERMGLVQGGGLDLRPNAWGGQTRSS